ncbi:MAG: phosphoribosylglycinamide formyltransferase [Rhizobiaceae bacterium]|nr:phosphoribosylglycinamide formyltransferase [Rhizobiaceae bacterium]
MSQVEQPRKKRVGVLISGTGSNMKVLAQACQNDDYPAEICIVISDKPGVKGLDSASEMGIEALAIPRKDYASKTEHEAAILTALDNANLDYVCLAGFMRILSGEFIKKWSGRLINIHPSLLPLFPGLHTHDRAIEAGCKFHGCTVHFVTEGMDEGPVISQAAVPILPNDTADILAARVLKTEHILYPRSLKLLASGQVRMTKDEKSEFSNGSGVVHLIDEEQYLIN